MNNNEFTDKIILVTGGTGSIGSMIVKELLVYNPKQIRIFSRDETKQVEFMHEINQDNRVRFLIGDVRDKERLNLAMEDVNIVFHAAALKHVVSCENNPFEAIKTNVQGTQNVIDCAFINNVEKVIGISTDKATDPMNVMGCTKLLAEKIMLASYHYKGHKKTKFSFVRFGNVLFSRGSVVPLFINQIKKGGSVTITDERMNRFVMSTKDAVRLVFKATEFMIDREIFILKMPIVNIVDLAHAIIKIYAPRFGRSPDDVNLQFIGKKNGERIVEKLLTSDEVEYALETDDMFIITPVVGTENINLRTLYNSAVPTKIREYTTDSHPKMLLSDIVSLLQQDKNLNSYCFYLS